MHALAGAGRAIGGRYRLRELIGRGAMGNVWQARDELLDRDVAVKEVKVPAGLTEHDRDALYQRTLREAKTAARLNHRGLVTVFDVVEENGRPWIVMELVRARSLDRVLAFDGPLPVARAAAIGHQLVGALAAAHAAGVLHRDVKPSNVLLGPDGRAVLTDFGIATFEGDERLTMTGMVMGTPAFTPPERVRGGPATPASDLWSLGATLYAAVQGTGPYADRGDAITTMNAVLHEDAPPATMAGPLAPLIAALLQRDPAARPDAGAATQQLSAALRDMGFPREGSAFSTTAPSAPGTTAPSAPGTAAPGVPGNPAPGTTAPGAPSGTGPAVPAPVPPGFGVPPQVPWPGAASAAQSQLPADAAPSRPPSFAGFSFGGETVTDAPAYQSGGPASRGDAVPGDALYASASPGDALYAGASPGDALYAGASPGDPYFSAPVADALPRRAPTGTPSTAPADTRRVRRGPPRPGRVAGRRRRRGGPIVLTTCAALVIVAAGVFGGVVIAHGGHSSSGHSTRGRKHTGQVSTPPGHGTARVALPAGYHWYSVPAASAGTTAGFRLAVPAGWQASTKGLVTFVRAPGGTGFMEIDLTRHTIAAPLADARWLELRSLREGKFPGYQRLSIRPVQVAGSRGALWSFTWQEDGVGQVFAQDYLFGLTTSAGSQSYAVYGSAPAASWRQSAQMLTAAIRTFRPLA